MQLFQKPVTPIWLLALVLFTNCRKELSCETCAADPPPPVPAGSNHPPVARAGADTTFLTSVFSAVLNGSASSDPDNNITAYQWTKISGPAGAGISGHDKAIAAVNGLTPGVFTFELTVTDAGGLVDKDTVQLTVAALPSTPRDTTRTVACDGSTRRLVPARLVPAGELSFASSGVLSIASATKIVFAKSYSRYTLSIEKSNQVDILDLASQTWTRHTLNEPRAFGAGAALGNSIFLAETQNDGRGTHPVEVYHTMSDTWSTIYLPQRSGVYAVIAAAAAGNKVLFISGAQNDPYNPTRFYTLADIYDVVTGSWRTDTLAQRTKELAVSTLPDEYLSATVIGSKVYIAGNASDWNSWTYGTITAHIDIYDAAADSWTTDALHHARGLMGAVAVGTKNYWAGGIKSWWNSGATHHDETCTDVVEIRDMTTGTATFGCLFTKRYAFSAVASDQKVLFFTGGGCSSNDDSLFDIYDEALQTWSIGMLPFDISGAVIVAAHNTIYVAAGKQNGAWSNKVWKLEF